ncbi:signal transduction histidine kinase [Natronocella acetinitrilica]|uniref:histidine kinase n=1 Tax=Natronocella acetinitrilica TaxID=414046 RepID=A0AAE3G475_9GAMM|nr:GAF domain-containing hybrid sensor histidine kinase/response regulator [Natronocella acetinitrilica]MCP1673602.1 signal transduction histidine kinase [Natronocella acetinitrilica]
MIQAPSCQNESSRLAALQTLGLLDTAPEPRFDRLTRLAAAILGTEHAAVTLVDKDRQWFKSIHQLDVRETSRDVSFCAHAVSEGRLLVVNDALQSPAFRNNPVVTGPPHVRFYAGVPLAAPDGSLVGAFCVFDTKPRDFDEQQQRLLEDLAEIARGEINAAWSSRDAEANRRLAQKFRRRKEVAEASSREKSRFLAQISHEIRTPMNGLIGMLSLLEDSRLDREQLHYLQTAKQAGQLLLRLVDDVLDLSRIEAGRLDLKIEKMSLTELVEQTASLIKPLADQKELRFETTIAPTPVSLIRTDHTRLQQVLLNLLGNAVKFTQVGGVTLSVARTPSDDGWHLEVSDTGPGIPEAYRERIFEPFEQVPGMQAATREGAGLGLAIARYLVLGLGGSIAVDDAPGGGCRMTVMLPDLHTNPSETGVGGITISSARRLNLLVVEDDPLSQIVARQMLERDGHRVTAVGSVAEAAAMLGKNRYEAVFIDMNLPDGSGAEVVNSVAGMADEPLLIALTASPPDELEQDVRRRLAACLRKPLDRTMLRRVLEQLDGGLSENGGVFHEQGLNALLGRLGGDHALAEELFAVFEGRVPVLLADLSAALERQDRHAFRQGLHALKGQAANLGLEQVAALCSELEATERVVTPELLKRLHARVQEDLARLKRALHNRHLSR